MGKRTQLLGEFMAACYPEPTPQQVSDWQAKHPRYGSAIADMADMMRRHAPGSRIVDEHSPECMREEAIEWESFVQVNGAPDVDESGDARHWRACDLPLRRLR